MFKIRFFGLIGALGLAVFAQAADTNEWVMLGNYPAHPTRVLAKYKDSARQSVSTQALKQIGSRVHRRYTLVPGLVVLEEINAPSLSAVHANDQAARRTRLLDRISALQQSGLFEYVEPDYIVHSHLTPDDQAFVDGTLWGLRNTGQNGGASGADIDATSAWDFTTGSTNVIVAVIDTGIRYTHQDLASQMWHNPDETASDGVDDDGDGFVDDVFGINAINMTGDPFDDNNHGTHVSGTIGAAANDGHPHVGVTWNVQLMGCKFLSAQGFGNTSDAITCIDYAVSKKARILNNSWGGGPFEQSLFDAINRARIKGVLFVASAGNDASNSDLNPAYPASYQLDNIISVAAIDRNDNLADFSNFGQATTHLGAPGVDIFSSTAGSDADYQLFNGTSQAAPHVSGVAALILSLYPGADLEEVRGRILGGVVPILSLNSKTITGGRLNAINSLTLTGTGILHMSIDPPSSSTLLSSSIQPIFVKVTDVFGVNNATVTGTIGGSTNLIFANDGQPPDVLAGDATYTASFQVPAATGLVTLTISAVAPGESGVTNVVTYSIVPPPPNDNFTNATKVPAQGAVYFSNNRFATIEPAEPFHANVTTVAASLWWAWSSTNNTNVLIDTTGSAIDSVIAVYTGNSLSNLQQVAAANDSGQQKQAHLSFDAQAGAAYRIVVASMDTNSLGSIQLRVAPGGELDTSPPFVSITSPPSGLPVTNKVIGVTGIAIDPAPNASGVKQVLVRLNGGIAGSAVGTTNWSTSVLLKKGVNLIAASAVDAAGNSSSLATAQVTYLPIDPENDLFANAIALTGNSGTSSISNTNATKESGEPNHAGNAGGKSIWWSFTPASDGVLTLSTTNSTFDTMLAMYLGSRVDSLTSVTGNDDADDGVSFSKITQAVRANQTYRIAVDGFGGADGTVSLSYNFASSALYQVTINATTGGSVNVPSGPYAAGTTLTIQAFPDFGYEFVGWDGSTSTDNPLSQLINSDLTLTARFEARSFTDGFESGDFSRLPWAFGVRAPWSIQSNQVSLGGFAARSGSISNNQSSSLFLTTNTPAGIGSFDYKVSSETNWDWLEFYVNGVLNDRWSGEVGWQTRLFTLPAGLNMLEWRYVKDFSLSFGLDAAFIDNVDLPSTPTVIGLVSVSSADRTIQLLAQRNYTYVIEASADLTTWQPISTNAALNGVIRITDSDATRHAVRFYRAVGR
jgi:subtilisin family serine protease